MAILPLMITNADIIGASPEILVAYRKRQSHRAPHWQVRGKQKIDDTEDSGPRKELLC
jgi:hypothetical protein